MTFAAITPTLTTANLTLRGHRRSDFDIYAELWADPDVTRHISGKPSTRDESWARLCRQAGLWPLLGFGYWVVETHDGRFVGDVGFADFQREMGEDFTSPEMGWVLAPWAHGRGWASEAVAAALAWGDVNLPEKRTVCMIAPENGPSIRVAEKAGFTPLREADFKGSPSLLFERIR
jgi:RimJ/RimL family protein N-acetyltransferase